MRRIGNLFMALLLIVLLPFAKAIAKEEDEKASLSQCELVLGTSYELLQGALLFDQLATNREFKISWEAGNDAIFKALGLAQIPNEVLSEAQMSIHALSGKRAKQLQADYALTFFHKDKKNGRTHYLSEIPLSTFPLFLRAIVDLDEEGLEKYLADENIEIEDLPAKVTFQSPISLRLDLNYAYPFFLTVGRTTDGTGVAAQLGVYIPCSRAARYSSDFTPVRVLEGWTCAVPILNFFSEGAPPRPSSVYPNVPH